MNSITPWSTLKAKTMSCLTPSVDLILQQLLIAAVMADQGNMFLYEITCGIDVLSLPSDKEWHDEQANDPFCFSYIKYLTNKEVPEGRVQALDIMRNAYQYVIDDNILYKKTVRDDNIAV